MRRSTLPRPVPSRSVPRPSRRDDRRPIRSDGPRPFAAFSGRWATVIDFYALLLLLAVCALGGGSSFAEVPSLLYVRPVAFGCLLVFTLSPAPIDWRTYRTPMLFLACFAALMLLQLVPLPPAAWLALPGRAPYRDVAAIARLPLTWRPLSLTPDLTANSLVALLMPAAMLIGFAKLRDDQRSFLLPVLVALCFASTLLGIGQFAGGGSNPLYLYQRTYEGYPVGFLSNRNHQAAFLSLIFPALRVWTLTPVVDHKWARNRLWLALGLGVFTVPVVLGTGSRAGIALMALSIAVTFLLFPTMRGTTRPRGLLYRCLILLAVVAVVVVTYLLGRAASIERLMTLSAEDDRRFQSAPAVLAVIRRTFPVGTGLGSFDPVFRQYEPDAMLVDTYFNHAHNELLELALTAGAPGLLLLAGLLGWWCWRSVAAWRSDVAKSASLATVRLGSCVVAFLLLASLVDYPLRTPLLSTVFALGCAWLQLPSTRVDRPVRTPAIVSA